MLSQRNEPESIDTVIGTIVMVTGGFGYSLGAELISSFSTFMYIGYI